MMDKINNVPPSQRMHGKDTNDLNGIQFDYSGITSSAIQNDAQQLTKQLEDCQDRQDCQQSESASIGILTTWRDTRTITKNVSWAWDQWLPNGFVTMIASEVGQGKSMLALWMAGLFTTGEAFPTSEAGISQPGKVLWIETEQGQVMNIDRLTKFGLDDSMFLNPLPDPLDTVQLENPEHRAHILNRARLPEVVGVVVDSLSGAHRQGENTTDMIEIMAFLARLAQETNKPLLLNHHFNKLFSDGNGGPPSLGKIRGSSSILQFCRVIWAIDAPNTENKDHKRLSVIKSNLSLYPAWIGFRIEEDGITFTDAPEATITRKQSKSDIAVEWLYAQLMQGPVASQMIQQRAVEHGISPRTLERAKKELLVGSSKKGDGWYWALPEEDDHEPLSENVGGLGNVGGLDSDTGNQPNELFGGTPA
jgi:DNA repair protein RadA/Sms